jgi:drug/metabolite transporter (DMT)-like permease
MYFENVLIGEKFKHFLAIFQDVLMQNPLPFWCAYVAWCLLILTTGLCAFFLILYSMQWGSTTSEEWLAAFFAAFFESFFLIDPIKVRHRHSAHVICLLHVASYVTSKALASCDL